MKQGSQASPCNDAQTASSLILNVPDGSIAKRIGPFPWG